MSNVDVNSPTYVNPSEPDPIEALLREICIVFANGTSFCARLVAIRDSNELWFETKSGQRIMVQRQAVASIRPLHHPPWKGGEG